MAKVVVVGAGPAGLAAAEALAGRCEVTLVTLGHILGGKACSWQRDDGWTVEHGQHVMLGFYDELRALLRRSGVDPEVATCSTEGDFTVYEERDGGTHQLHLGHASLHTLLEGLRYTGWSGREKAAFARFFTRVAPEVLAGVPTSLDDLCLTAWCLERGFPPELTHSTLFRASRDAQLSWPGEISAYAMLRTIRVTGRDYQTAEARFPAGGMSATWWEPIARRVEALGGEVQRLKKLVGLEHRDGRLTGLRFARPLPHGPGRRHVEAVPTGPAEPTWTDLDAAVLTLPCGALAEVLDDELAATPGLSGVSRLTSIAPLGLHVWHRERVRAPRAVVCGLPVPLGYVMDNKWTYPEYRDDPGLGAALHFVGQETCFEDVDDETLLHETLRGVRRVRGYEGMSDEGVLDWCVVRNRAPHKRYWNAEPGSWRFKPEPRTPVRGLYLAGDWVRSELDFPCMETAVRSGREAAGLVLDDLGAA